MSIEQNKAVVRSYADAFSRGDFHAVASLCTPDILIQGVLGAGGLDVAIPIWQELHKAFAIKLTIEDMVAEGETVAVRYQESGTFRGGFRGKAPTGKSYILVAMEWFKFRGDKIAQRWGARDFASMMKQMED